MTGVLEPQTSGGVCDSLLVGRMLAGNLAELLEQQGQRLVLAESCTAGWCAALLSAIPGISRFLCGSLVTYQNESKMSWLRVSASDLADQGIGPVSETVARQMLSGALACTPQADLGAAVTGHLGPQAPPDLDGVIYVAVGWRAAESWQVTRYKLTMTAENPLDLRAERQLRAVRIVYEEVLKLLQDRSKLPTIES